MDLKKDNFGKDAQQNKLFLCNRIYTFTFWCTYLR